MTLHRHSRYAKNHQPSHYLLLKTNFTSELTLKERQKKARIKRAFVFVALQPSALSTESRVVLFAGRLSYALPYGRHVSGIRLCEDRIASLRRT